MMPDHAQLVARATSLVPTLRARAAEAEQLRPLPDANVAKLRAAGLFKVLQPRRCGGFEMSLHTHIDTPAGNARGCGSAGRGMGGGQGGSGGGRSFSPEAPTGNEGATPACVVWSLIAPP